MRKALAFIYIALVFVCLSGCSPIKTPPVSTYSLNSLQSKTAPRRSSSRVTLGVGVPTASSGYTSANMIYMMTPYQLSNFVLHRWVAPPAQMILPIVVQALRVKGYFKAVVSTPYSAKTNYRLDFQLLKLQQNFMQPISREQVAIQVNIFNNVTNQVIGSRRFSVTVPARENTPYSGVLAASRAVNQLSQQIANFAVSTVR